jgi:hypothetical protein
MLFTWIKLCEVLARGNLFEELNPFTPNVFPSRDNATVVNYSVIARLLFQFSFQISSRGLHCKNVGQSGLAFTIDQCCNESSHWLGLESTRVTIFSDLTGVQYEKWLDSRSTAPNDSTLTRLADVCPKWLESNQLQLVENKFIKIIVIVLLGKNNESFMWTMRTSKLYQKIFGDLHRLYIPDGHAYYICLSTLVSQFLKWSLKIL